MSTSVEEIKVLINNYNNILEEYKTTNNSLSGLGSYIVLSNKTISGGNTKFSGKIPTVEACQAKCASLKGSFASYNSDSKVCRIATNVSFINVKGGSAPKKVIVYNKLYYLNKLNDLNKQLSNTNNQIVQKINTSNQDQTTIAALNNELSQLKTQLDEDKDTLSTEMLSTTANLSETTDTLDLEYVREDEHLAISTITNYYIFLLFLLMFTLMIVAIFSITQNSNS